ncbi:MAG TPA: hypothetical protein VI727_02845 [Candidatus Brocadiaceae bacterium]|nr:hypothetical protein [Candidatus Brocadiaceae bacterium]
MDRLAQAETNIRKFVNEHDLYEKYFKSFPNDWNLLTVAMDTLGDSTSALTHFERTGIGSDIQEKYLLFYGMFQAIVLQQDAISNLYRIFHRYDLMNSPKSAWQEIRKLRNMATGHPLDKSGSTLEGKLRIFVAQNSISITGFMMIVCEKKTAKTRIQHVDFKTVCDKYKVEALGHLSKIEQVQKSDWS